jgi:dihydroflavonol-4-reductase
MKVLVTGATGFVGTAVARQLLAGGHELVLLARAGSDRRNVKDLPATLVEGDLQNEESLIQAVQGCEALFHVAADYRIWVPEPASMYETNVVGTGLLMEAALKAGVKRIVYTSSVATLGTAKDGSPADEETPVTEADMIGVYKHSKFMAEQLVQQLIAEKGLPAVIVNPSTPIGPKDVRPTPTGQIIVDAARGLMPAYVDTGLNVAHVDDVAKGHVLAFEKGQVGRRYILGGEDLPLAEILAMVAKECGRPAPTLQLPREALFPIAYAMEAMARFSGHTPMLTVDALRMAGKRMFFSSARAEKELGYTHRPASQAIHDAYFWFKANGYI